MNLHGQINVACESRPGHPQPCLDSVALLARPSGTIHPAVDRHEFTWSDKCCL